MVSQNRHQICQAGGFFSRLCLPGRYRYFVDLALIPHFFKQGLTILETLNSLLALYALTSGGTICAIVKRLNEKNSLDSFQLC